LEGKELIDWAASRMAVLAGLLRRFETDRPLLGARIGACLHVTPETGVLLRVLTAGGAEVALAASNPLSTRDEVAEALVSDGVATFAHRGDDPTAVAANLDAVIDTSPLLTVDDGCDLLARLHLERRECLETVVAGTEDTTSGAIRLRSLAQSGGLAYPVLAVSGSQARLLADNRHGTAQSTIDGILRATNTLLAGSTVVVAGYGNCGHAVADVASGLGAQVVVTEIDPSRALAAMLDGYRVEPMDEACAHGDVFVTATGNRDVVRPEHMAAMRDGAVLANAGQFDLEIDVPGLEELAGGRRRRVRPMVDEYVIGDPGRPGAHRVLLLAEGRLVNLAAADGSPPQVMDVAFAVQALACEWLWANHDRLPLPVAVHEVPEEIDRAVARLKLETLGVRLDVMTESQASYLASWGRS
jgi:adenosylhomocysteinase